LHPPTGGRASARRLLSISAAVATAAALTLAVGSPALAAGTPHALPGSAPGWLHKATKVGAAPKTEQVDFGLLLNLRDRSAAEAQLQALSDPSSASYGKWLTTSQFDAAYAPAASDVSGVRQWLTSQGFTIRDTLAHGLYIEAKGDVQQVEKTFGTTLNRYRYQGKTVRSNAGTLTLPSGTPLTVSGAIDGVIGLDQASALKKPADTLPGPPPGGRYGVQPCSAYFGQKIALSKPSAYGKKQPYAVCGYGPQQYQSAYGESGLLDRGISGKGVTVAITDAYAAPTIAYDAQRYSAVHHQPLFKPGQFRQITPGPNGYDDEDVCDPQGWYGEETLDVEAVHAMAPGANVVFVGAADCESGLDEAWAETIDSHVADIVTNSWNDGVDSLSELGQDYVDFYVDFSLEGALTGITDNFSTGDSGDETAGGTDLAAKTVGFPADVPYVTGVGGTSVEIGSHGQWLNEYGWQTDYAQLTDGAWTPGLPGVYSSGGGGGTSTLFAQPFYQRGVVPTSVSEANGTAPARAIPDISMPGDPNTGFEVGETQQFPDGTYWDQYRIGGTSLSSPLEAGVMAVATQYAHHTLGFVNPLYYKLVHTPAVHDIVAPKHPVAQVRTNDANGVDGSDGLTFELQTIDVQSSTLHDTPGWDDETGVGTPNGPAFFAALKWLTRR